MDMRPHTHFFAILALFSLVFGPVSPTVSHSAQALSIAPEDVVMPWYGPTYSWEHEAYTTMRFTAGQEKLQHTLGGEELRRMGYLPLTTTTSEAWNALFLFDMHTDRVYDTGFTLPNIQWCNGCATSSGLKRPGFITMKDGMIVVEKEDDVYLLDPETRRAQLWLTAEEREGAEPVYGIPAAHENVLYLIHPNAGHSLKSLHRIDTPGNLVEDTSIDVEMDIHSPTPLTHGASYLMMTDFIGGYGANVVGQIGTGVYMYFLNSGPTKIGYTDTVSRTNADYVTLKEPRMLDRKHTAWIGADNALYVANTKPHRNVELTGILDVPRRTAFGIEGSPEIYYHDYAALRSWVFAPAYYNFTDEEDFYELMNTDHFRHVVWLPAHAADHADLQQLVAQTETTYEDSFRNHVYSKHQ